MRKTTQGLITACAGLVAGAAFGATPALAGPGWWPPGHVLGYYNTLSDCGGYASSLSLWDADYDCDYQAQRVGTPYVLVIQRPVQIVQPAQPVVDYEPAPVAEEPTGGALAAEKPAKPAKAHKANKANKGHKAHKATKGQAMSEEPAVAEEPGVAEEPAYDGNQCVNVASTCGGGAGVLAVPMSAPVGVVPLGGPVVVGGPYVRPWGGVGPWGGYGHRGPWGHGLGHGHGHGHGHGPWH
ncbi:hypothetical protein Q0Z83_069480 [Actinoplanes sichuanensis]|uniref:Uncharacterized protein n=1 Tax=Actinoplanes sichuanensis TaxID=512349 RepID=A0ABW4ABQ2_9ACTN|nr:hypothetical protein [Actinoplanes sichuanensis]BEL08757.1 hypothetical protein Q0Z83_069480 [Actinoplanes sichuanensis]